jgi:hypothetical protein
MTPTLCQQWRAPNDTNGNPRRCALIFNAEGQVLDVIDEGYAGYPQWVRDLHELPWVYCNATTYRQWLKCAAVPS